MTAEADLPPIRLHDLRHGAASLSLAAGNELKTVQAMLGHSSIVLTADTYTSVLPLPGPPSSRSHRPAGPACRADEVNPTPQANRPLHRETVEAPPAQDQDDIDP